MAETDGNGKSRNQIIGMDMRPPYGVYVDHKQVAEFHSESEAQTLYDALTGRTGLKVFQSVPAEVTGMQVIDGAYCQYGDEVKAGDLVAANFDSRTVHTGGGLYLLEMREGNRITWSGCRRMIRTPAGIDVDKSGYGDWVNIPDMDATDWHVVGTVETVYSPSKYQ